MWNICRGSVARDFKPGGGGGGESNTERGDETTFHNHVDLRGLKHWPSPTWRSRRDCRKHPVPVVTCTSTRLILACMVCMYKYMW